MTFHQTGPTPSVETRPFTKPRVHDLSPSRAATTLVDAIKIARDHAPVYEAVSRLFVIEGGAHP